MAKNSYSSCHHGIVRLPAELHRRLDATARAYDVPVQILFEQVMTAAALDNMPSERLIACARLARAIVKGDANENA